MNLIVLLIYLWNSILLNGFNYYSFCNQNDGESNTGWPNGSIKITTENNNNSRDIKENDTSQYDLEDDGISIKYKIKSTAKCIKIEYGNELIWGYNNKENNRDNIDKEEIEKNNEEENEGNEEKDINNKEEDKIDKEDKELEYPNIITLKPYLNNIWLNFPNKLYIYSYRNDKWELLLNSSINASDNDPSHVERYTVDTTGFGLDDTNVKIININNKDPSNIIINNIDDFEIMEGFYFILYRYKKYNRSIELRYNNKTIWKDLNIRNGHKFPSIININSKSRTITFDFSGWYLWLYAEAPSFFKYVEYKWLRRVPGFPVAMKGSFSKLKIFTIDDNNNTKDKENEGDKDSSSTNNNIHNKQNNDNVEDKENNKDNDNNISISNVDNVNTTRSNNSNTSSNKDKDNNNISFKVNDNSKYIIEPNKEPNEDPKDVFKYKFKEGTKCVKIMYDNDIIWYYDKEYDIDYPIEIYADIFNGRSVKVKFPDRHHIYRYIYSGWELVSICIDGMIKYDNKSQLLIPSREEVITKENESTKKEEDNKDNNEEEDEHEQEGKEDKNTKKEEDNKNE